VGVSAVGGGGRVTVGAAVGFAGSADRGDGAGLGSTGGGGGGAATA
jgi:hypothetical protein